MFVCVCARHPLLLLLSTEIDKTICTNLFYNLTFSQLGSRQPSKFTNDNFALIFGGSIGWRAFCIQTHRRMPSNNKGFSMNDLHIWAMRYRRRGKKENGKENSSRGEGSAQTKSGWKRCEKNARIFFLPLSPNTHSSQSQHSGKWMQMIYIYIFFKQKLRPLPVSCNDGKYVKHTEYEFACLLHHNLFGIHPFVFCASQCLLSIFCEYPFQSGFQASRCVRSKIRNIFTIRFFYSLAFYYSRRFWSSGSALLLLV